MKRKNFWRLFGATLFMLGFFLLGNGMQVSADDKIPIDKDHFPDPGFRAVIASQQYDWDRDGFLNDQERGVYNVYCKNYPNVKSLEGIEYFPDVRGVWCENCNITGKLSFKNNPEITGIWCSGNPITEIDLSGNPKLEWIYCFQCDLEALDLTYNPKMGYLEISENPRLKSIDLSVCPDLEHLIIFGCPLESLDLSNNTKISHLDAFQTGLKYLDLGNNPNMKRLDVWGNPGLDVDVSGLPGLEFYNCADNDLTHLDVSHNPQLMALFCDWNDIPKLDLSHNPRLCDLRCACNQLTSLDISHNPLLYYFQIFGNPISSVNVNNNPRLRYILDQVEKGNGSMVYDPNSMSNDYLVDFGGDREYMDELRYFISVKPETKLIADKPNASADVYDVYINVNDGFSGDEDFVTRGEAIQTLYEMAGSPKVNGKSRFTDVAGTFCEKAVIWGEQNNICYGYPNLCSDTFCGDVVIARQDFALMVHHYAEDLVWLSAFDYGRTDDKADFLDVDYYAWGAVTYGIQWEILETKNNYIYPHGRMTTAEVEKGLKEFLEHVEKSASVRVSTKGGKGITGSSVRGSVEKADGPAAPTKLVVTPCTKGKEDGIIRNVTWEMEYSTYADFRDAKRCPDYSYVITNLPAGTYFLRYAETNARKAGESCSVTVKSAQGKTLSVRHNVEFDNNIAMHYVVPKSELAGYSNLRLVIDKETYKKGMRIPYVERYVLENPETLFIGDVEYWHFTFPGIASSEMGNRLYARVTFEKGGSTYLSQEDAYSVKDYAYDRLDNSTSDSYKKILVDMLNYGAASQIHFNRDVVNLVNANLTNAQKKYGTSLSGFKVTSCENLIPLASGGSASFEKKNLQYENRVILLFRMDFASSQKMDDVKVVFQYNNGKKETTLTVPYAQFTKSEGKYVASCDCLTPADMGCMVNATIYDGNKQISGTLQYSIESYVKTRLEESNSTTYKDLMKKMILYGRAVKAHFK